MSDSAVMDSTELEIQANEEKSHALVEELQEVNKDTTQKKAIKRAKGKIDVARIYKSNRLTHKERKPNAIIKPEVRELIRKNVVGKDMKTADAMKAFNVSRRQIQRIKAEDPNQVKTCAKRPSKFTEDMKTKLQKSTTTLPEMAKFILEQFDVKVLIHDMDISWKQVTNTPAAWNWTDLIEQRANFVGQRGLDLGQKVVFTDEAGFDLHSGQGFGYAPSGQPAVLSLVPKAKQESIIIMDNAPVHQGKRFKEVIGSLEASKSIKIEFLPPYSPFLNPIKYSFHSIKAYV
ncbi:hypothetical protein PSTG_03174 [Puccinia striiformis f. sp. tritici PST-78]|uniref:Tc1-like transposase DDE domain-containing protein n=1 Tax=Puccinia striiformis f. sp. tritici PST-78 TaxID=1165861 RepID=A0A0L0VWK8_9BASI|nr:hypothetical protein PSTG_03174 [Puccinia striiformis f. sp. tritici PST-78]